MSLMIRIDARHVAFIASLLCACSSNHADLPKGWGNASRVKSLVQEVCPGSDMSFSAEHAAFTGAAGSIDVDYQDAHFRCEQDVEGFFKAGGTTVDILVQPIDMHPSAVAMCDCGYNITFVVEPVPAGNVETTLYRRWDSINNPNDPVPISAASVLVE
jgi:hypothetical protein